MKKIAITGGSGFVGTAIYRECLKRGYSVVLLDRSEPNYELPNGVNWIECDATDLTKVSQCIKNERPDQIYLIAGVLGTAELNDTPHKAVVHNISSISTFMELASKEELPPIFYATKPNVWKNMYTYTKEASENIIKYYIREGKVSGVIHKWYNIYGEGQSSYPVRKVVPYFILSALNNKPLEIWGDGEQTMDLIYVKDVAYLAVEAMNSNKLTNDHVIDIGRGIEISVNKLADMIIGLTYSNSEVIHRDMRSGETSGTKLAANTEGIYKYISQGYQFFDLEETLKTTINYYSQLPQNKIKQFFKFYNL